MTLARIFTPAALLLCAAPAFAQEACDGDQVGWLGGSADASDVSTAETYQEQMALVLEGNAFRSAFTVSEPTAVRIEAAGRGGGDPMIILSDASGAQIAEDDDSGGDVDARIEQELPPGTYCVEARSYGGNAMTAFVRVGREEHEALTTGLIGGEGGDPEGCFADDAPTLAMGESATASASEAMFYTITLDAPTAITLTANNSDADPAITLYDGESEYLADNDDFDGLNSRISMQQPLEAGNYCLNVEALSDADAPITVSLSEYDPEAEMLALVDRGEAAPAIDGGHPIEVLGTIEIRKRVDTTLSNNATWYQFTLSAPGLILIEAVSPDGNGDPAIRLFDDFGREIAYNDDGSDGLDSQIATRVQPGTYLLALTDVGETGGPIRLLFERYVPAQ